MKGLRVILPAGAITAALLLGGYFHLRIGVIESYTAGKINSTADGILKKISEMEKAGVSDNAAWSGGLENLAKKTPSLSLLAAADKHRTLLWSSKNKNHIPTDYMYDALMKDFTGGSILPGSGHTRREKYYGTGNKSGPREEKLYCYVREIGDRSYLAAFVYRPDMKILIRVGLEISLILVITGTLSLMIYLILRQKGAAYNENDTAGEDFKRPVTGNETHPAGSLQNEAKDLFNDLSITVAPDRCILHGIGRDGSKMEEFIYTGVELDSGTAEEFPLLPASVLKEILHSPLFISDEGKTAYFPLVYQGVLAGTLMAHKETGITGKDIAYIRNRIATTAPVLGEHMIVHQVLKDPATGLFSKNYFKTKLGEYLLRKNENGGDASIVLIELENTGAGVPLEDLIRSIVPMLEELLPQTRHVCRYDRFIAVILPDVDSETLARVRNGILASLGSAKLKISDTMIIPLKLKIGGATANSALDEKALVTLAIRDLRAPML